MNVSFWNVAIPALSGLIGVFIGSLKPIIDWKIDNRKFRREERKHFIENFRYKISQMGTYPLKHEFFVSEDYSRIRPHLSKRFINFFENGKPDPGIKGRHAHHTPWLLDEIHRIERKWGLL